MNDNNQHLFIAIGALFARHQKVMSGEDLAELRQLRTQEDEELANGQFTRAARLTAKIDAILQEVAETLAYVEFSEDDDPNRVIPGLYLALREWGVSGVPESERFAFIQVLLGDSTRSEDSEP